MRLLERIEAAGMCLEPSEDMKTSEAKQIIRNSRTAMEVAGSSYIYGYMNGAGNNDTIKVPVLNIKMMSDERWNELARKNRLERQAVAV